MYIFTAMPHDMYQWLRGLLAIDSGWEWQCVYVSHFNTMIITVGAGYWYISLFYLYLSPLTVSFSEMSHSVTHLLLFFLTLYFPFLSRLFFEYCFSAYLTALNLVSSSDPCNGSAFFASPLLCSGVHVCHFFGWIPK